MTIIQLEGFVFRAQCSPLPVLSLSSSSPNKYNAVKPTGAGTGFTRDSSTVRPPAAASMKFLLFSAAGSNGKVSIGWKVTNEKDQFEYIIERSVDGVDFMPVGTLVSRPAFSNTNNYSFTDLAPVVNRANYYRIRSVDIKGGSAFSSIVKVKLSTPVGSLFITPSPADASATLNLVSKTSGTVGIRLLNTAGRLCWHLHFSIRAGANVLLLDGLEKLPEGMYTVQCNDGRKIKHLQLLIRHQ